MNDAAQQEMKYPVATRESVFIPVFDKPLFVIAYWPPGKWWRIHGMFAENQVHAMGNEVEQLQMKGWAHVQIMRLPEQAPT